MTKWLKNILTSENGKTPIEKDKSVRADARNAISLWTIPIAISLGGLCALAAFWKKKKDETEPGQKTVTKIKVPVSQNLTMKEYVKLEQTINDLSLVASETLHDVVVTADDLGVDREETLAFFIKIMTGLLNQLDLEDYEPIDDEIYN